MIAEVPSRFNVSNTSSTRSDQSGDGSRRSFGRDFRFHALVPGDTCFAEMLDSINESVALSETRCECDRSNLCVMLSGATNATNSDSPLAPDSRAKVLEPMQAGHDIRTNPARVLAKAATLSDQAMQQDQCNAEPPA